MTEVSPQDQRVARAWLDGCDTRTLRFARIGTFQVMLEAVVGIGGVTLLGWSPAPIMLFMLLALWSGLLEVVILIAIRRLTMERNETANRELDEVRARVRQLRDGERTDGEMERAATPRLSLASQVFLAAFFIAAFTGSLVYQLATEADSHLFAMLAGQPEMIATMGALLLLRVFSGLRTVGAGAYPSLASYQVSPILDALLFIVLLFAWQVSSAVASEVVLIVGGESKEIRILVFVLLGYALALWRSIITYRDLGELRKDLLWISSRQI